MDHGGELIFGCKFKVHLRVSKDPHHPSAFRPRKNSIHRLWPGSGPEPATTCLRIKRVTSELLFNQIEKEETPLKWAFSDVLRPVLPRTGPRFQKWERGDNFMTDHQLHEFMTEPSRPRDVIHTHNTSTIQSTSNENSIDNCFEADRWPTKNRVSENKGPKRVSLKIALAFYTPPNMRN